MFRFLKVGPLGALLIFGVLCWGPATATECSSCDQPFPEAQEFLAAHGYPADAFEVLVAWNEVAPDQDGFMVNGFRVRPRGGGAPFDLYADDFGAMLTLEETEALGIRPKNWDIRPVEQEGELPEPVKRALPERPRPVGPHLKKLSAETVALPALDLATLVAEDLAAAQSPVKQGTRTGVFQWLPEPVSAQGFETSHGAWQPLADGGFLWSVSIHAPGAVAQRICFDELETPPGSRVIVYNADAPVEAYGPYEAGSNLWSASCFAEEVFVECYVPESASRADVRLTISKIAHVYASPGSTPWQKSAGACNIDATCHPTWATVASGIGRMQFVSGGGTYVCTGTLVVDSDPGTQVPYFLTAHHCISLQSEANTLEVYWLYQTSSCNGVPPSLSTVPRTTGGADYLAGRPFNTGNDFALLRLKNAPPSGLTYVGWTTALPSQGTAITGIHHPAGDYRRISFGSTTSLSSSYHEVVWHTGVTEGGSSGSPLLLSSTGQIVGQLYGGFSSCATPTEPDYYGRFDVTFPIVESWLGSPGEPLTAPVITTNGGNGPGVSFLTNQTSVTLQGTCSSVTNQIRVNGSTTGVTYAAGQTSWSYTGLLLEGPNLFSVVAVDAANNTSDPDTITVTRDTVRPQVTGAYARTAYHVRVTFNESMADSGLTTFGNYSFSGSGVALFPSQIVRVTSTTVEITVNEMTHGASYTVTVSTSGPRDLAGNFVSATAHSASFSGLGQPPPSPTITTNGGLDFTTESSLVSLAGTCSADTASIRVNGLTTGVLHAAGQTSWSYSGSLFEGQNDFEVVAVDAALNVSVPAVIAVTRTTAPPRVTAALAVSLDTVRVFFSEPVMGSGLLVPATYTFDGGEPSLTAQEAARVAGTQSAVDIRVNAMTQTGVSYEVTVSDEGVVDAQGLSLDLAAASAEFLAHDPASPALRVGFDRPAYTARENDVVAVIGVVLSGPAPTGGEVAVFLSTEDGTAVALEDYHPVAVRLSFTGSDTTRLITIPIINDTEPEDAEWFMVRLNEPEGLSLEVAEATVTILDNDSGTAVGDVDGNGSVNAVDVQYVILAVLGYGVTHDCDVNGDGRIDALDLQIVINTLLGR